MNATDVRCERVASLIPDDAAFSRIYGTLPDWRRRKCDAFRFAADKFRSAAVWVLLREMLAARGVDADALPVTENEFGKPAFDPSLGIHFNLSHAGERVMAVVDDGPVGCDVERIAPFDEVSLAARSFGVGGRDDIAVVIPVRVRFLFAEPPDRSPCIFHSFLRCRRGKRPGFTVKPTKCPLARDRGIITT